MPRRVISISILVICALVSRSTVAEELQIGKAQEGTLHDRKGPTYILMLKAGDYVEAEVDLRGTELIIAVCDPAGSKFRAFRLDEDYGAQFRFVAEAAGAYRLEVAGQGKSKQEISASRSAK
jgi:hypothetical protein